MKRLHLEQSWMGLNSPFPHTVSPPSSSLIFPHLHRISSRAEVVSHILSFRVNACYCVSFLFFTLFVYHLIVSFRLIFSQLVVSHVLLARRLKSSLGFSHIITSELTVSCIFLHPLLENTDNPTESVAASDDLPRREAGWWWLVLFLCSVVVHVTDSLDATQVIVPSSPWTLFTFVRPFRLEFWRHKEVAETCPTSSSAGLRQIPSHVLLSVRTRTPLVFCALMPKSRRADWKRTLHRRIVLGFAAARCHGIMRRTPRLRTSSPHQTTAMSARAVLLISLMPELGLLVFWTIHSAAFYLLCR